MIVISSSMGKSGSTLICNIQEDMLALASIRSGQSQLRKAFNGRFIKSLSYASVAKLLYVNARFGSVVIKTHSAPTPILRLMINLGFARATYSYRDVRDVILSALDHGKRNRKSGSLLDVYTDIYSVEDAVDKVGLASIHEMNRWKDFGKVHFIQYEKFMQNKLSEVQKMSKYLNWLISDLDLVALLDKHDRGKATSLNFNKGTINRYRAEMTEEEIQMCNLYFRDFLVEMNYEL